MKKDIGSEGQKEVKKAANLVDRPVKAFYSKNNSELYIPFFLTIKNSCNSTPAFAMTPTLRFSAVFFDLDGTLVDSAPDILHLIRQVLMEAGLDVPPMDFHLIGPPLEEIFDAVAPSVSPERRAEMVLAYRALYRVDDYARSRVFSGIPGLLRMLWELEIPAFVATNKPEKVTRRLLASKGILDLFTDIASRDSIPGRSLSKCEMLEMLMRRHVLSPASALMVGDSRLDISGGRQAGLRTAAALYGYGKKEVLLQEHPDFIVEDEAWKRMFVWPDMTQAVLRP